MYLTIDVHIYCVVFPFFLKNVIKLMTHPTPNKKIPTLHHVPSAAFSVPLSSFLSTRFTLQWKRQDIEEDINTLTIFIKVEGWAYIHYVHTGVCCYRQRITLRKHTGSLADSRDMVMGTRSGKGTFHHMPLFFLNLAPNRHYLNV